jgi:hypothetical protein
MNKNIWKSTAPGSCLLAIVLFAFQCAGAEPAQATAVQINLDQQLNARVVITQKEGRLQLVDNALDTGGSILITKTAAEVSKAVNIKPLPDSGIIAANDRHPEVKLHYADGDAGPQVHRISARTETCSIPVPAHHYRQMQAFFISANGPTPISATLHYADGSSQKQTTQVPDFFFLPAATDKAWFILVNDFGKVDKNGKMTETDHHYIHGFDLNPDSGKVLQKVEITKENSGSVLNLFGLTGTLDNP